jgi:hypothetical protein
MGAGATDDGGVGTGAYVVWGVQAGPVCCFASLWWAHSQMDGENRATSTTARININIGQPAVGAAGAIGEVPPALPLVFGGRAGV